MKDRNFFYTVRKRRVVQMTDQKTEEAKKLFASRLRAKLEERHMNQNTLAELLGMSESSIGKWTLGKSMPRTMDICTQSCPSTTNFGYPKKATSWSKTRPPRRRPRRRQQSRTKPRSPSATSSPSTNGSTSSSTASSTNEAATPWMT